RNDRDQRQLIEPVTEERDELARPEGRERAIEGEPDVRVLPDAPDGLGLAWEGDAGRAWECGGGRTGERGLPLEGRQGWRRHPGSRTAEDQRPFQGDGAGQGGR